MSHPLPEVGVKAERVLPPLGFIWNLCSTAKACLLRGQARDRTSPLEVWHLLPLRPGWGGCQRWGQGLGEMSQRGQKVQSFSFKIRPGGVPVAAQQIKNPASIHKDVGLIPGLAQWVKDLVLL